VAPAAKRLILCHNETVNEIILFIDGACKGNPGAAGIGVLLTTPDGETIAEIGEGIGQTTNNVAEYKALIRGLEEALSRGADRITVHTDSQLMARQMEGRYKINAPHLRSLQQEATALCRLFSGGVTITHILREGNARADALANQGARLAPTLQHDRVLNDKAKTE